MKTQDQGYSEAARLHRELIAARDRTTGGRVMSAPVKLTEVQTHRIGGRAWRFTFYRMMRLRLSLADARRVADAVARSAAGAP